MGAWRWTRPGTAVPLRTLAGWRERTPDGFLFAAKVPQTITHEKLLREGEEDLEIFVEVMRRLGPKLGALLLQFPYFKRDVFPNVSAFLAPPNIA